MSPQPGKDPLPSAPLLDAQVVDKASAGMLGILFKQQHNGGPRKPGKEREQHVEYVARLSFYTQDSAQIRRIWRAGKMWTGPCLFDADYVSGVVRSGMRKAAAYKGAGFRQERHPDPVRMDDPPAAEPMPPTIPLNNKGGGGGVEGGEAPTPPAKQKPAAPEFIFRRGSEIKATSTDWFDRPWIFKRELIAVVGGRGTGKSTYGAYLVSKSRMAVILPGTEGSVDGCVIPRLLAQGVDLDRTSILETDGLTMPSRYARLLSHMKDVRADLLLIDPMDDFLDLGIHPNSEEVRPALKAFQRIAQETGAAVVGIRNPGKAKDNVCRNNTAWGDVPRRILQLIPGGGPGCRSLITCYKPGKGTPPPPTYYDLVSTGPESAPVFKLCEMVSAGEAEVAMTVQDRMERKKLDVACDFIRAALAEGEQEAGWVLRGALALGLGTSTMYLAKDRMGVTLRAEGGGKNAAHYWVPPETWPDGTTLPIPPSPFPDPPPSP